MNRYVYNVTINADASAARDVRYYIEHKLFPIWGEREGWSCDRLMLISTPEEDGISLALQFQINSLESLQGFNPDEDPLVHRIRQVYGDKVLFFPTLMEVIG